MFIRYGKETGRYAKETMYDRARKFSRAAGRDDDE